jgi:primosomal protein N' (replication factor Y)
VPPPLDVQIGQAVRVPFGNRLLQGIVVDLPLLPAVEMVRDIESVMEPEPLLSARQIEIARWIANYYLCSLYEAIALFLPPGFGRRTFTFISPVARAREIDITTLAGGPRQMLERLLHASPLELSSLEKALGKKAAREALSQLLKARLVERSYRLGPARVGPRLEACVSLGVPDGDISGTVAGLEGKRAFKQAALLKYLAGQPGPVSLAELARQGYSRAVVNGLRDSGLLNVASRQVQRLPIDYTSIVSSVPLELTAAQRTALDTLAQGMESGQGGVYLLHGVTGSGKTEVYLQALARAVSLGRQAIVLVPEIALTSQTIQRFASRFPGRVAVLHSGLSLGEQYDQWRSLKNGDYDVVIGARSALFAPLPATGLIVMDEEHEWTYKQQDKAPRYHTRRVAAQMAGAGAFPLLLGSATPDVESYFQAKRGRFHLLELPERLTPYAGAPMPAVEIVDLRAELKSGNTGIFSHKLHSAIALALEQKEQVILFFNRRGAAPFVQCRRCGAVIKCRRCQVSMSYHSDNEVLKCHQCDARQSVPQICPVCQSRRIKYLGLGTQRVEKEVATLFPQARLLRWDSDSARGKGCHAEMLRRFQSGEADILIGTQMVAKGLHLPRVTLVGVVSADTALNLPDFRAGERTFQLLSQVAGRAGRGSRGGKVIIQSYCPEHYAIQAVGAHDYRALYKQEIEFRRSLGNPPFSQMVSLTFSHGVEAAAMREAERLKKQMDAEIAARGMTGITVIGPAPAFVARLRGRYRVQILLRGRSVRQLISDIAPADGWVIDIDPLGIG